MSDQGYPPVPPVPPSSGDQNAGPAETPHAAAPGHAAQPYGDPGSAPAYGQPVDVPSGYAPGQVPPGYTAGQAPPTYGAGQVPPAYAAGQVPPAYGPGQTPPPMYMHGYVPQQPAPKKRRWVGWVVAAVILGLMVLGCVMPFVMLFSGDLGSGPSFGDAVAVIPIDGIIAGTGDTYSGYITPEYLRDQLDRAEEDPAVKAVVLRVNSPGGTVAASEELAQYVKECTKPVVVSIGDIGASGAYMLASQADEIWAMPGSSVGSIGVITEIPNVAGLLDKVGVEFQVITAGKYKDAGSPYRDLTDDERALIQGEVDEAYDQFIGIVADGRDMSRSEVETLATGWAWSGARAKELKLIDKLGTYEQALDRAAELGKIEGDYEIMTYEDPFGDVFGSLFSVSTRLDDIVALLEGQQRTGTARPLPR